MFKDISRYGVSSLPKAHLPWPGRYFQKRLSAGASQKSDYLAAVKDAGFKDVKVLDETVFPSEFIFNDPIAQSVIKENKITAAQAKKIAASIVSVKISAVK
jgi:arsenite methyltransferase